MRMNRKAALVASVGMVAFTAACSDSPTAPVTARTPTRPNMVAVSPVAPVIGQITVCKVWEGTAGGATTINSAVTLDPGAAGTTTIVGDNSFNSGECTLRATTTQGADFFDEVTTTEVVPAGAELILVQRFDVGGPAGGTVISNGAAIGFNVFHGSVVVFTNRLLPPPPGNEGCTPGYWKQEQHFGSWAPVALNTTFSSVFGAGIFGGTLLQALENNGGGLDALIRHGAAAYLNAQNATVDYAYTTAQVIDIVQGDGAYAGLSVEERKDLLDAANNGVGGCPLDRAELD
jgi:hypothetical protein